MALVVNLTLPVFASDFTTGSAFGVDERLLAVPRLAATANDGSSGSPYYVKPDQSTGYSYRFGWTGEGVIDSTGTVTYPSITVSNWGSVMTGITESVAYSIQALAKRLHSDNSGIYDRLGSILTAIKNNSPSDIVKIADNTDNNFTQDYIWKKWLTASSGTVPTISQGGVFRQQSINWSSMSVLGAIEALFYYPVTGITNGVSLLVRDVRDNDAALDDYLYDSQLNATLIPRTTIWQNMRDFWTNTSDHLAHLRYVLANDDDISLRQTQHDNMATVTSDFTSGDVSVTPAKLGGLKSVGSALTGGFSSSASVSDGLSVLGSDSDAWDWFTDENAQAFDSVSGSRNLRMFRFGTCYLDKYYMDVMPYVN